MPNSVTSPSHSQCPTPRSGILTTPAGDRHIPQSVRPDGSLRKEIRIRPGYRPPEDVEVYKNRTAEAWKTQGAGGIPGALGLRDNAADDDSRNHTSKNHKRREARKRAKAAETTVNEGNEGEQSDGHQSESIITGSKNSLNQNVELDDAHQHPGLVEPIDPEAEMEKQVRNLKKKLRQARELKDKKDSGTNLLPEQFAKVIKMNELIRQLDSLGFDSDGSRKLKDVR